MIKANVISDHSNWIKNIENPNDYINKRLKILSKAPKKASVGKEYSYAVKVWRQKPDEKINYKLFYGPEGMKIEPNGSISWRPNPIQIDSISVEAYQTKKTENNNFDHKILNKNLQKKDFLLDKIFIDGRWQKCKFISKL